MEVYYGPLAMPAHMLLKEPMESRFVAAPFITAVARNTLATLPD